MFDKWKLQIFQNQMGFIKQNAEFLRKHACEQNKLQRPRSPTPTAVGTLPQTVLNTLSINFYWSHTYEGV